MLGSTLLGKHICLICRKIDTFNGLEQCNENCGDSKIGFEILQDGTVRMTLRNQGPGRGIMSHVYYLPRQHKVGE